MKGAWLRRPTRVRSKIALTLAATGLITALGVMITVALAFQSVERESASQRAHQFLDRVMALHDNVFELYERHPEQLTILFSSLVSFEPNSQLYLLDDEGAVLAGSGSADWSPGARVRLALVRAAISQQWLGGYVRGDDPRQPDAWAIVAARPVQRSVIRSDPSAQGYLYVVSERSSLRFGQWGVFRSSVAWPALAMVVLVVGLGACLAGWMTAAITRPLHQLSLAVAQVTEEGLHGQEAPPALASDTPSHDEWDQLRAGIDLMLRTLRTQWHALRRLDHFRREGVSNLSHDLRSPLTATVVCLETLGQRWATQAHAAEDRRLLEVALRNTHNAARLVRSLGELAQLDEPSFELRPEVFDLTELLDDIAMRFADRALQHGVALRCQPPESEWLMARVDIELFERAMANLLDNALKFTPRGGHIALSVAVQKDAPQWVRVSVRDDGVGIAASDQARLFDRFYQSRQSVAPATGEGGKGLGLAIVQRIAELHSGSVSVSSQVDQGTCVSLILPLLAPPSVLG